MWGRLGICYVCLAGVFSLRKEHTGVELAGHWEQSDVWVRQETYRRHKSINHESSSKIKWTDLMLFPNVKSVWDIPYPWNIPTSYRVTVFEIFPLPGVQPWFYHCISTNGSYLCSGSPWHCSSQDRRVCHRESAWQDMSGLQIVRTGKIDCDATWNSWFLTLLKGSRWWGCRGPSSLSWFGDGH